MLGNGVPRTSHDLPGQGLYDCSGGSMPSAAQDPRPKTRSLWRQFQEVFRAMGPFHWAWAQGPMGLGILVLYNIHKTFNEFGIRQLNLLALLWILLLARLKLKWMVVFKLWEMNSCFNSLLLKGKPHSPHSINLFWKLKHVLPIHRNDFP